MSDIKTGSISITGLADLEKRLLVFPDRVARNILAGAIRAGAVVIQREARDRAPIGTVAHYLGKKGQKAHALIQPGSLKKGVKVRLAPRKSRERPIEYWIYVSSKLWYWKFVEFGTTKMAAQPFMRPAFEGMKERAVEKIRDYLDARIDKEAAKQVTA